MALSSFLGALSEYVELSLNLVDSQSVCGALSDYVDPSVSLAGYRSACSALRGACAVLSRSVGLSVGLDLLLVEPQNSVSPFNPISGRGGVVFIHPSGFS